MEQGTRTSSIQSNPLPHFTTDRSQPTASTTSTSSTSVLSFHQKPLVAISDTEIRARVQWVTIETRHFSIAFDRVCYHEMEANTLAQLFEELYATIFSMTHEGYFDRVPVYLCDLRSPSLLGRTARTHFNIGERSIYIMRSAAAAAEAQIVSMITHSMRFGKYLKHYGITPGWAMLEDAFATFMTERIGRHRISYPFFGIEPDLIAYHLIEQNFLPSLSYAWPSVRFSSTLERTVVAGAFLLHLGDTASDDTVIAFAKCDEEVTSDTFRFYFGRSLEQLEANWMKQLPKSILPYSDVERARLAGIWSESMSRLSP